VVLSLPSPSVIPSVITSRINVCLAHFPPFSAYDLPTIARARQHLSLLLDLDAHWWLGADRITRTPRRRLLLGKSGISRSRLGAKQVSSAGYWVEKRNDSSIRMLLQLHSDMLFDSECASSGSLS
jgi:hypothetical protein